jgi:excisionase family DNA binding protein
MATDNVEPLAVRIPTAAKLTDTPERTIAAMLREGRLCGVKVGRSWRVRVSDLKQLVGAEMSTR